MNITKKNEINKEQVSTNTNKEEDQKLPKKQEIFIPVEQDSLFWCYFIMKNGDIKYETIYKS